MALKSTEPINRLILKSGERIVGWQLGRLSPMPSHVSDGWELVHLTSVAKLESGHTPSRRHPEYWDGDIPWISLHDSAALDVPEIHSTAQTISSLGLENSSARLLPKGTVVFSRTATVGKSTVMGREMATSQDFANYICGKRLHNHYLVHLFRFMAFEWKRLMAGSTHSSIYMPVFQDLQILLPPVAEQEAIAEALSDADVLIESLGQLIAKKRQIKQGAMQELLTGKKRLLGFSREWEVKRLGDLLSRMANGAVYKPTNSFGLPITRIETISDGTMDYLRTGTAETSVELENYKLVSGDILFSHINSLDHIGKVAQFLGEQDLYHGMGLSS